MYGIEHSIAARCGGSNALAIAFFLVVSLNLVIRDTIASKFKPTHWRFFQCIAKRFVHIYKVHQDDHVGAQTKNLAT